MTCLPDVSCSNDNSRPSYMLCPSHGAHEKQSMVAKGQSPTQHTAGAFLDALKLSNKPDRCIAVFREMMDVGVDLGDVCFNIVVSALVQVTATTSNGCHLRLPPRQPVGTRYGGTINQSPI